MIRKTSGVEDLLYADDLLIWASSSSLRALEKVMNQALKNLEKWADKNCLTVSRTITVYQVLSLTTKQTAVQLTYKGVDLERQDEAAPFPAQTTLARCLPNTELLLENHNDPKHLPSDIALRKAALETIHTKYPAHEWLHIYCDGSSMPDSGRTGVGYVSTFFKGSIAVGAPLTNYDGEIAAIHEAAKNLENF
ncbi:uncharacterized protein [Diabrotica undecimpunctata]|uniref:uncharacterized protein n=1 Tax=Diabrotica undecimpunctata TaxID=50387 RepID=UPI003B64240A